MAIERPGAESPFYINEFPLYEDTADAILLGHFTTLKRGTFDNPEFIERMNASVILALLNACMS